jgi:hypothetical protein
MLLEKSTWCRFAVTIALKQHKFLIPVYMQILYTKVMLSITGFLDLACHAVFPSEHIHFWKLDLLLSSGGKVRNMYSVVSFRKSYSVSLGNQIYVNACDQVLSIEDNKNIFNENWRYPWKSKTKTEVEVGNKFVSWILDITDLIFMVQESR